jgi:ferritin-like metal-binding protein YciE
MLICLFLNLLHNMTTVTGPDMTAVHSTLEVFFNTMLQEIYWSETNLINVLNSMADAATSQKLKQAFEKHAQQTQTHVSRVEEVFSMLGADVYQKHCIGLQGLFDEGWGVIDETEPGSSQRDVALTIAAQKVEHYEMACYGSLVTLAKTLGRTDVAELLVETLIEEKETDAELTILAESNFNPAASKESANGTEAKPKAAAKKTATKKTATKKSTK